MLSRDCRMYYEIIHYVCYITNCSVSKTIRLNTESDKKNAVLKLNDQTYERFDSIKLK